MPTWQQPPKTKLEELVRDAHSKISDPSSAEPDFEEMFGLPYSEFTVHAAKVLTTFFKSADFNDPEVWVRLYALGFLMGGLFRESKLKETTT